MLADALVAAFNPQLAVTSHAAAAVAIERHVVSFLAGSLGLDGATGTFTTGGAEANLTAVVVALERHFPEATERGLASLNAQPTIYLSAEAHHSFAKAARIAGLGHRAIREIPADARLRLDPRALRSAIERDRSEGMRPFLVVATAGSTAAGAIDPLPEIAQVCVELSLDLHVDAAWAGAVGLSPRLRRLLDGIERADSVTVDAHKWLSAPMAAGVFLTRHGRDLARAFRVTADYMPSAEASDPYLASVQWSRRFIGLKVFMSLAAAGRSGYAAQIERDCHLGDRLRKRLARDGWRIVNETPLPVVCSSRTTTRMARTTAWRPSLARSRSRATPGSRSPSSAAGTRSERASRATVRPKRTWTPSVTCLRSRALLLLRAEVAGTAGLPEEGR